MVVLVAGLVAAAGSETAAARTITVTSQADALAGNDGACTLREAVRAANDDAASGPAAGECPAGLGADTIDVAVAGVKLTRAGAGEDDATTGDLDLTGAVTLAGRGTAQTVIDAGGIDRAIDVRPTGAVTLRDIQITGGRTPNGAFASVPNNVTPPNVSGKTGGAGEAGGGVRNEGTLTVARALIRANVTGRGGGGAGANAPAGSPGATGPIAFAGRGGEGGTGGGLFSTGALTVTDSTISDNVTGDGGAGGGIAFGGIGGTGGADGGIGFGGTGGDSGFGGGLAVGGGQATVSGTVIAANRLGTGGPGGEGIGGGGGSGLGGGRGGTGSGGSGGTGGFGAGAVALGNGVLTLSGVLLQGNVAGAGGPGGVGRGGVGGIGTPTGTGGTGGTGSGGSGGTGGLGGGAAALGATLAVRSSTLVANQTGPGGDGAMSFGGTGGKANGIGRRGGQGGSGSGGSAGSGGSGAGVLQATTLSQVTVVANAASSQRGSAATGRGGEGGLGDPDGAGGASSQGFLGSPGRGGGVFRGKPINSIVSANLPDACSETQAGARNLVFPDATCGPPATDPVLGALSANGGPTATFALSPLSPAIDSVPASGAGCEPTDQRGVPRPQGAGCDIGAYERAAPRAVTGEARPSGAAGTALALAGTVNPFLREARYRFELGTTTAYGTVTPETSAGAGLGDAPASATVAGLRPDTLYHYRLVATNADGTTNGADRTARTPRLAAPAGAAPRLSRLTLSPGRFRPRTRRSRRGGTRITWRDTQAATTSFGVERAARGVRRGRRCVAPPRRRARGQRRCTRHVPVRGGFTHRDRAGANSLTWPGTLRGRALPPGDYRLTARPSLRGRRGATARASFRIPR